MSELTLDEAIKHCLEVADKNEIDSITYKNCKEIKTNMYEKLIAEKLENDCRECAADHRQLAEWLTNYKDLKNSVGAVKLELLKEAQAELEKRGNMLHDTIAELEEAKRLLKMAVEQMAEVGDVCDCIHSQNCPLDECGKFTFHDEIMKFINN